MTIQPDDIGLRAVTECQSGPSAALLESPAAGSEHRGPVLIVIVAGIVLPDIFVPDKNNRGGLFEMAIFDILMR